MTKIYTIITLTCFIAALLFYRYEHINLAFLDVYLAGVFSCFTFMSFYFDLFIGGNNER